MQSKVESHPEKQRIIDMMLRGMSLRAIGRSVEPAVSAMALHRYKRGKLAPALRRARESGRLLGYEKLAEQPVVPAEAIQNAVQSREEAAVKAALDDDPLLRRVETTWARIERSLDRAEARQADGDFASTWSGVGQAHRSIELHAKLTGGFSEAPQGQTIVHIGVFDGPVAPAVDGQLAAASPDRPKQPTAMGPNAVVVDVRR